MPTFHHRSTLPHPRDAVFAWHARAGAFERLTPPWEDVRVVRREGGLDGGLVVLKIRKGGVPVTWELRHTDYEEGHRFRDEQVSGPFSSWVHTHRFRDDGAGGCVVEDEVEWEGPLGEVGRVLSGSVIRRQLERLFPFRHERLHHDLARHAGVEGVGGAVAAGGPGRRMRPDEEAGSALTVAITGASGLVGSALSHFLTAGGHRVLPLVRGRRERADDAVYWSVEREEIEAERLEGVDAVVHLAGEPLFSLRWSESKKRRIRRSRVEGTSLLARTLAGLDAPPRVFVSASGVNYYGGRGNEILGEDAGPGTGFLAEVCREWEAATAPAERAGIRTCHLRTAPVVTPAGGFLSLMLPVFRMGLGGRVGSGRQYVPWIDHDDHVGLIHHLLFDTGLSGPVNAAAPHPVTNATFTNILGRVLGRPTVLWVPSPAVKLALGDMAREALLPSVRAVPRKAEEAGFEFFRAGLEESLVHQLGRRRADGG